MIELWFPCPIDDVQYCAVKQPTTLQKSDFLLMMYPIPQSSSDELRMCGRFTARHCFIAPIYRALRVDDDNGMFHCKILRAQSRTMTAWKLVFMRACQDGEFPGEQGKALAWLTAGVAIR